MRSYQLQLIQVHKRCKWPYIIICPFHARQIGSHVPGLEFTTLCSLSGWAITYFPTPTRSLDAATHVQDIESRGLSYTSFTHIYAQAVSVGHEQILQCNPSENQAQVGAIQGNQVALQVRRNRHVGRSPCCMVLLIWRRVGS
jgi:hypothetical protein